MANLQANSSNKITDVKKKVFEIQSLTYGYTYNNWKETKLQSLAVHNYVNIGKSPKGVAIVSIPCVKLMRKIIIGLRR